MKCIICGEEYSEADLHDLRDMHEDFSVQDGRLICPDCMDFLNHEDPEDQIEWLNAYEEETI